MARRPALLPAHWRGSGWRPAGPGGSCQRRLPCSSCARQRPLRQCHTAASVMIWPTTTREGNRLPEGSMALGPHGRGRSRRSSPSEPLCEAGQTPPFPVRGAPRDKGPPRRPAPPHCLPGAPRPAAPTAPPPSHRWALFTASRGAQLSCPRAELSRSRLAQALTPAYPQPHPGGGACGDVAKPQHPHQPGRPQHPHPRVTAVPEHSI